MTTTIRQPAVAGRFYPRNAQRLREEIETFTTARAAAEQRVAEPKIRRCGLHRAPCRIRVLRRSRGGALSQARIAPPIRNPVS